MNKKESVKGVRNIKKNTNIIKKFWNFLWNGDSLLSWVCFLIFIFVVIKFIFFPTLSLLTGTSLPIVIVESCSMYHDARDFDKWWEANGEWYKDKDITKEQFKDFKLINGFSKGDIFLINGVDKDEIKLGDTIIFTSGQSARPIIHRVVNLSPLATKGDNNDGQFSSANNLAGIDETNITEERIIGKATNIRIPLFGWIKLIFYEPFRSENDKGFCK